MPRRPALGAALVGACLLLGAESASATWSIVAVDRGGRDLGVAVASCVDFDLRQITSIRSAVPPFGGRPGEPAHGALIVQARVEQSVLQRARSLHRRGLSADELLARLRDPVIDPLVEERQFAVVDARGRTAAFTGARTLPWSGSRQARGVVVAGNLLTGPRVVDRALAAFHARRSGGAAAFPRRLMTALTAGAVAGGDRRCRGVRATSAALSVSTPTRDISIRTVAWRPRRNAVRLLERRLSQCLASPERLCDDR